MFYKLNFKLASTLLLDEINFSGSYVVAFIKSKFVEDPVEANILRIEKQKLLNWEIFYSKVFYKIVDQISISLVV